MLDRLLPCDETLGGCLLKSSKMKEEMYWRGKLDKTI